MPKILPSQPDFEQLKKQAKELLRLLRAGDPTALSRAREHAANDAPSFEWSLNAAQLVLAREYGFPSWAKLKTRVTEILEKSDPAKALHLAFESGNAELVGKLFAKHPEFKAKINEPLGPFDSPAILHVKSRPMLDVLIQAGADLDAKSRWWAGGFGLLHLAPPELAIYAIERGARVDAHAAARLGLFEQLRQLIQTDPSLVHSRGGDGQTPLHFAKTIEIAALLLEHGAQVDARDIDHEPTPAQYMIADRQDIAKFLIHRGCQTDLFMAAALGDQLLAERHIRENRDCLRLRVSDEFFPKRNHRSGGTIYQWTLGWHVSPTQVAEKFGHLGFAEWLSFQSSPEQQLLDACWRGKSTRVHELLRSNPHLTKSLSVVDHRQLANAARNNQADAVRLFLEAGFPVDVRGQHGGTPLHWAAWHGNVSMVKNVLQYHPPLEERDFDFQATPLGWATHGSENGWEREKGDYAGTVRTLLQAGAVVPEKISGTEEVQKALRLDGRLPGRY